MPSKEQENRLSSIRNHIWNLFHFANSVEEAEEYKKMLDSIVKDSYECGVIHIEGIKRVREEFDKAFIQSIKEKLE